MKEIILTDPFTGINFKASQYSDNSIVAIHPLTGETIKMQYDFLTRRFMLPIEVFEHIDTLTYTEAADETNVSVQRISAACKSGKLKMHKLPSGAKMILRDDLTRYANEKKNGRPRKDD